MKCNGNWYSARTAVPDASAMTLLKFARTTTDPNLAAGLLDKAADLKSRVDTAPDPSPLARTLSRRLEA
jgi:hypothetical protein